MITYFKEIQNQNNILAKMLGIKKIKVDHIYSDYDVTVQVYDHEVLASCNHAGAEEGTVFFEEGTSNEYDLLALICDKCGSYKLRDDYDLEGWND